jgi:hypothetical protein
MGVKSINGNAAARVPKDGGALMKRNLLASELRRWVPPKLASSQNRSQR